jgi:long-chain acyl-CoA synthetase
MTAINSIVELLQALECSPSNPNALNSLCKDQWQSLSSQQLLLEVHNIALGLITIGIRPGDFVAILAHPCIQWTVVDLAIMSIGAVTVPLFANSSGENFLYEVKQTGLKHLFISTEQINDLSHLQLELFDTTILLNSSSTSNDFLSYGELLSKGQALHTESPQLYLELQQAVQPNTLATIVYTSGSTGVPQGVEITHSALLANIEFDRFALNRHQDRFLSVLPLAHIFGRVFNLFMLYWGVSIYYGHVSHIGVLCRTIHPTCMIVVPRLLEKIYSKMLWKIEHGGFLQRTLGLYAFQTAHEENENFFKTMTYSIFDATIYSVLRDNLGGHLRLLISEGAALDPYLAHFFKHIGLPICEGWGLTEASTVAVNDPKDNKIGTVGKALPGVQVKRSLSGELLVKGGPVMRGYFKDPQATQNALDEEGWLHTGDQGEIDDEGFIKLSGRKNEIFKTSGGQMVAPIPIEQALCRSPLIDMALVVGKDRPFISCLLFPDFTIVHDLKANLHMEHLSNEEFLQNADFSVTMHSLLENINQHLNQWEKLRQYRFIMDPLTIQSGELTPSMKIRRDVVLNKYASLIDEIYRT